MVTSHLQAQTYQFSPYPDLWYNDIDGIRIGARLLGEVEGTFNDGPHRLDAGLWVGSKIPSNPVSYYFSITEPIKLISDFDSEGNLQLISLSRTGYALHQIRLHKRWQKDFNELNFFETSIYSSIEKNFEFEYRFDPDSWSSKWKKLIGIELNLSRKFESLRTQLEAVFFREMDEGFNSFRIESKNAFNISKKTKLRARVFLQSSTNNAYGEYHSYLWTNAPINWLQTGFKRSVGIIQESWVNDGLLSFSGGPNLRGYKNFKNDSHVQFETVYGINIEYEFPNPINSKIKQNQLVGDLVSFQSYMFIDVGAGFNENRYSKTFEIFLTPPTNKTGVLGNTGLGVQFSVNIPDHLGKDRGIFIRYDLPFWVSSPSNNESNLKFRNVLGIGAVFNF